MTIEQLIEVLATYEPDEQVVIEVPYGDPPKVTGVHSPYHGRVELVTTKGHV